jgi:predicted Zn-dependent protease
MNRFKGSLAEAERIILVSEDHASLADYRIFLSDFPRRDILGLSIDRRRIYISYRLAKFALQNRWHYWLLRQTLAHEIAHETAGHASRQGGVFFNDSASGRGPTQTDVGLPPTIRLRNYSYESELEADLIGLGYWRKLNWNCAIWIRILESFLEQNYMGDVLHPTDIRLQQAKRECRPAASVSPSAKTSLHAYRSPN